MSSLDRMFALTRGMVEAQAKVDRAIGRTPSFLKPSISNLAISALEQEKAYTKLGIASLVGPLSAAQVIAQTSPKYNNSILGISAAQFLHRESAKYDALLGSSAVLAAMTLQDKRSAKTNIHDLVGSSVARTLFEQQKNIFRKIESQLQYLDRFASLEELRQEKSDLFDAISISKLTDIVTQVDENGGNIESYEESIAQINELVDDEIIKSKLAQLMNTISKLFARKGKKATHQDFENIIATRQYVILFIHNNILGRTGLSFQATNVFIDVIDSWIVKLIIVSSILEPIAQNIAAPYIGLDEKTVPQGINKTVFHKHYKKVYNYNFGSRIDESISNCQVYLRNSIKTKCLGTLVKGTIVEVLQDKPNWSFIRANIECFDKKTKITTTYLLQAWVKKSNLKGSLNND